MKRSEFRELIREVLIESLPEIIEIISEISNSKQNNDVVVRESVKNATPDMSLLRSHVNSAISNRGYDELPGGPTQLTSNRSLSNIPAPNNPVGIVNGEKFVSGKGIMEWVKKTAGSVPPIQSEFKHSESDIDSFINKKFGIK